MNSTILKSFLEEPCFRITPSFCQNDPFEFGITSKHLNSYPDFKSIINLHGIISLSKSCSIPSMWSHYGSNNSGFCVELEVDERLPFDSLFYHEHHGNHDIYFGDHVSYKDERTFQTIDNSSLSFEDLYNHYYFTKHSSWSSEQEYRLIVPCTYIDFIKVSQELYESDNFISSLKMNFKLIGNYYTLDLTLPLNKCNLGTSSLFINNLVKIWQYSFDKGANILFLKRIDLRRKSSKIPNPFKRIHLGLNFDLNKFFDEINLYMKSSFFKTYCSESRIGEIPIYLNRFSKIKLSADNYEMYSEGINKRIN